MRAFGSGKSGPPRRLALAAVEWPPPGAAADPDNIGYNDYDSATARELLQQEQFNDYTLVNVVGGKSWRVDSYYIGFFATINNVFDQRYRTGGFEDSRIADYRGMVEESNRDK